MSERYIGYLAVLGVVGIALACWLYMEGGRNNKIIRRLGGAFVLALTVNLISFFMKVWSPFFLIVLPALFGGFSMGYGANIGYLKVARRSLYALAVCASGLIFCLVLGGNAWIVLPLHIGVAAWTIWLGVKNPVHAAAEEVFVCLLLNTGLIMYPFVTGN